MKHDLAAVRPHEVALACGDAEAVGFERVPGSALADSSVIPPIDESLTKAAPEPGGSRGCHPARLYRA